MHVLPVRIEGDPVSREPTSLGRSRRMTFVNSIIPELNLYN
jgi:hypothetical protein